MTLYLTVCFLQTLHLKVEDSIGSSNPTPGSYSYKSRSIDTILSSDASYATPQTINVTDATGIQIGDFVTGSSIPSKTTVTDISGTTITSLIHYRHQVLQYLLVPQYHLQQHL